MKKSNLLAAMALMVLPLASAHAATGVTAALDMMRTTNLVTLGDYVGNGVDVEGKAWVGGNLTNGTTIGFGHSANPTQSAKTSITAVVTVMGNVTGTVNLSSGAGIGGGNYGAYIAGSASKLNLNADKAALIQVGGNLSQNISLKSGSILRVAGSIQQGIDTSTGSNIKVGGSVSGTINVGANSNMNVVGNTAGMAISDGTSVINVGGNVTSGTNVGAGTKLNVKGSTQGDLSIGANAQVAVGESATGQNNNVGTNASLKVTKNITSATTSTGSTVIAGGSLGNFNASNGSSISMGSYTGSNKVAATAGSHIYINSSIGAAENNGGILEVRGNIGDMQGYSAGGTTKVTGTIGGNGNGISNSPNYIYAGGTIAGKANAGGNTANVHQNYNYTAPGATAAPTTLGTPTAPTAPAAPTATELGSTVAVPLSTMTSNMKSLSVALLSTSSSGATATLLTNQNGSQRATIKVTSTKNNAVAVLNVNQSLFSSFSEIDYQFDNATTVVVVNVLNSANSFNAAKGLIANTNYTYNWNMNGIGSLASANKNQQIIWNFADAGNLNLNRETWGSFLAPNANVYNSNSINGSLVAKVFNQGGEVHLGTFNGFDGFLVPAGTPIDNPGSTPEPSSWATMMIGFGAIGTIIRRQKRRERELAKAA